MSYYVVRVKPRSEKSFLEICCKYFPDGVLSAFFPRRKLTERRQGKLRQLEAPLFAGYVFLEAEGQLSPELYQRLKTVPGFFHVLKPTGQLSELRGSDLALVTRFLKFGQILGTSTVQFDAQQRIQVLSGPMVGLEGQIISVDRRKRRAKILLDFDHSNFTISLSFEVLTPAGSSGAVS